MRIKPQQQGQEKSGYDDISQTQEAEFNFARLFIWNQGAGKENLDGPVETLGDGDHDIGPEDPEDVVKEQSD